MKKQTKNDFIYELNKRLGVVISLLLRMLPKEGTSLTLREQIKMLSNLGLRPKEIANILGRTSRYVNKELSTIRKDEKKEKHKET